MGTITMNPTTNVYAISLATGGMKTIIAEEVIKVDEGIAFLNNRNNRKFQIVTYFKEGEYTSCTRIRTDIER